MLATLLDAKAEPGTLPESLDERLWWALVSPGPDPLRLIPRPLGSLTDREPEQPIEVWTEIELASLHALSHHASRAPTQRQRDQIQSRLDSAAAWHTRELQPDNGTNHPWAVHVFARLGETDPHAGLHAQTLIHNATVASVRPDRFSACLLLDAGRMLVSGSGHA